MPPSVGPTPPPGWESIIEYLRSAMAIPANQPELLTADEAAHLLGCSRASLYRGVAAGTVPRAVDSPGGRRWRRSELMRAIERMRAA